MKQPPAPSVPSREGHQLSKGQKPVSTVLQGVRFHNTDYVKLFPQKHLAPSEGYPARSRRRQTSSPPQGPPASRPVGGLRTFREFRTTVIKTPAPLPASSPPQAPETTPSAPFSDRTSAICGAGKCRHEHRQCFSTDVTRIQPPCSAESLPPYAAQLRVGPSSKASSRAGPASSPLTPFLQGRV